MGKLYKTLDNIEKARQNAVRNAKAAGLPATDEMSLNGLSELYRLQNNDRPVVVDTVELQPWEEPEDWIDIKSILENEPNMFYNDKEYTPIFIMLLSNDGVVSNDILNSSSSSYDIILKTSDGQIMENTTIASSKPIVWDTTKDVPCSRGYNMRYIIYYWNTKKLETIISTNDYILGGYVFSNKPILKIVYGNFPFANIGTFNMNGGDNHQCDYIKVLDCLSNTTFRDCPGSSAASDELYDIKHIKHMTIRLKPNANASIGSYKLFENMLLERLELPGLTQISGSSDGLFVNLNRLHEFALPDLEQANGNLIFGCSILEKLNLPKLKIGSGVLCNSSRNLKEINLPVAEQLGEICRYCYTIKSIVLPKLKKLKSMYGTIVSWCDTLEELSLPMLEEIETTTTSYTTSYFLISDCPNLTYLQLPSLKNIDIKSGLISTPEKMVLDIPLVENISAACLSAYSNSLTKINAPSLKSVTINEITSSMSSGDSITQLVHNNPIDITIKNNYQNLSTWTYKLGRLSDDNVNHITLGRELNLPTLQTYLENINFKKVTCKITTGPTPTNAIKPIYLNDGNVLCRDGVELDLLDGSNMSTHTTFNHNNLVKFLTNLISLPEGETRTLTLGETLLAKLTAGEIAIATNKGWVLE